MYRVRVIGDGQPLSQGNVNCTIQCLYIKNQSLTFWFSYYIFYLASINGYGDIGPENNMTIYGKGYFLIVSISNLGYLIHA